MISYEEAITIILTLGKKHLLPDETVSLENSTGRISAAAITAARANQPFDNSAMDGFALRTEDLNHASNDNPVSLEMIGHVAAGGTLASRAPSRGQCYEIMTGAPLPPGCDSVVPVEKTEKDVKGRISFKSPAQQGDNIRLTGADFNVGDKVLDACTLIQPEHVLTLATLGIGKIKVVKKPRAAVFSTGLEIVDDMNAELKPGQIYNSTGPYLRAILPRMGVEQVFRATIHDDADLFETKLKEAVKTGCDVIISTGAVSAGVHDFIPSVLKRMGAEVFFHKVSIRPGKPIFFAKLPNGGPFFFGLPGNPVSTAVGLRFFVQPLLRALQNLPPEQMAHARLKKEHKAKKSDLRFFLRASVNTANEAEIIEDQQSFKVNPFVRSDAWVVIPENTDSINTIEFCR